MKLVVRFSILDGIPIAQRISCLTHDKVVVLFRTFNYHRKSRPASCSPLRELQHNKCAFCSEPIQSHWWPSLYIYTKVEQPVSTNQITILVLPLLPSGTSAQQNFPVFSSHTAFHNTGLTQHASRIVTVTAIGTIHTYCPHSSGVTAQ